MRFLLRAQLQQLNGLARFSSCWIGSDDSMFFMRRLHLWTSSLVPFQTFSGKMPVWCKWASAGSSQWWTWELLRGFQLLQGVELVKGFFFLIDSAAKKSIGLYNKNLNNIWITALLMAPLLTLLTVSKFLLDWGYNCSYGFWAESCHMQCLKKCTLVKSDCVGDKWILKLNKK